MLTTDIIKTSIPDLSDEVVGKIAALSQTDEDKVIGARISDLYQRLDSTIEKSTGIKRDGDEKTYNYLERAAKAIKETADNSAKEIERLTAENAKLQKVIADGANDAETKNKLQQAEKDLAAIRDQYNALKTEYDGAQDKFKKDLFNVQIEHGVQSAFGGVKFKETLSPAVVDLAKKTVLEKIKAANPESADDGNGGNTVVFKDKDGAILRNPDNNLAPYTVGELVTKELTALGVLAQKRTQTGSGGSGGNGGGGNSTVIDVTGAKSQIEAYDLIANALFAKGMTNGSREFDEEMQKAWKTNNVAKLPQR